MEITVKTEQVIRKNADHFFGINLNYIRDLDANRPQARSLNAALQEMGARWLRYPGGEKSDFYQWAQPPYVKPNPISEKWYARVKGQRMDFNQYIACVRAVKAEPYV